MCRHNNRGVLGPGIIGRLLRIIKSQFKQLIDYGKSCVQPAYKYFENYDFSILILQRLMKSSQVQLGPF